MIGAIVAGALAVPTPPVTGSWESIETFTVGAGGAASITFGSGGTIPQTYKHLKICWLARDNYSSDATDAILRFNSDSGSNYSWHQLIGDGSTAAAYAVTSQTSMRIGTVAGSTAGSNVFAATVADILDYTNTSKNKTVRNLAGYDKNGAGNIASNSGAWYSTAAITSITLAPRVGTSFSQYSSFALYGIKG